MNKKSYLKNQKGSITLFVLLSALFFLTIIVSVTAYTKSKETALDTEYSKIKQSYKKDNVDINFSEKTTPYLPSSNFGYLSGTSVDTGLVVQDSSGNQYVWIEVPKTIEVYKTAGLGITEFTTTDYTNIENDLNTYASIYGNETYVDEYYEGCGLSSEDEYNNLKQTMLKSVYQNGGFWVGRFEAGVDISSFRTSYTSISDTLVPLSKINSYQLTYVYCEDAYELATRVDSGSYTSSLMFGIQWDLILKYLENKGTTQSELISNSTSWGNYLTSTYTIRNSEGKYSSGSSWESFPYTKSNSEYILLTNGASDIFAKNNIYDLAGNIQEWTLEKGTGTTLSISRGGNCTTSEDGKVTAVMREEMESNNASPIVGFRVTIY